MFEKNNQLDFNKVNILTKLRIQIEPDLHVELLHLLHSKELYLLIETNREYLREWMSWIDDSKHEEYIKNFIKTSMKQQVDNLGFQCGIFYNNQLIGISGYQPLDKKNRCGEIGYWLSERFEGRGLMTKACAKIIEFGFEILDLNKIVIQCAVGNKKSRSLAERLGFKQEEVLEKNEWLYNRYIDHVVYSQLKIDQRKSQ